jgi:hypothetical protein
MFGLIEDLVSSLFAKVYTAPVGKTYMENRRILKKV